MPLRTPLTAVLMAVGLLCVGFGLAMTWIIGFWQGLLIAVAGLIIEFSGPSYHDRVHRRRGETPHAMWGTADRNRPAWLGGPRP